MSSIDEKIISLKDKPLKDKNKLSRQQEYYERLSKSGIAKKQIYSLKSVSAI